MMKFFGVLILFLSTTSLYAQPEINPTTIAGDTIEGESTDTSIVYIVKKAPVTIKQRVEIERAGIRIQKSFYFTIGISAFANSNRYKANTALDLASADSDRLRIFVRAAMALSFKSASE